jgi:hypothetical protein
MNPALPTTVKRILEIAGFKPFATDEHCWVLESNGKLAVIPHTMKLVPEDVLETILDAAELTPETFEELRSGLEGLRAGPHAPPPPTP